MVRMRRERENLGENDARNVKIFEYKIMLISINCLK